MDAYDHRLNDKAQKYESPSLSYLAYLIDRFSASLVPKFYQSLFINFIKSLPKAQAQLRIQEEVKCLGSGQTYVQFYLKTIAQKQKIQRHLKSHLDNLTPVKKVDIPKLCDYVKRLRAINYKAAHYLSKIRQKYEQNVRIGDSIEREYFCSFAHNLDMCRRQLQRSEFNLFVQWQPEYDPFFIHLRRHDESSDEKINQAFDQLLTLSVEQSFKLLKVKKMLLGWMYLDDSKSLSKQRSTNFPQIKQQQQYFNYDEIKGEITRNNRYQEQLPEKYQGRKYPYKKKQSDESMKKTKYNKAGFFREEGKYTREHRRSEPLSFVGRIKRSQISAELPINHYSLNRNEASVHSRSISVNSLLTEDRPHHFQLRSLPHYNQSRVAPYDSEQVYQIRAGEPPQPSNDRPRARLQCKNLINIEIVPIVKYVDRNEAAHRAPPRSVSQSEQRLDQHERDDRSIAKRLSSISSSREESPSEEERQPGKERRQPSVEESRVEIKAFLQSECPSQKVQTRRGTKEGRSPRRGDGKHPETHKGRGDAQEIEKRRQAQRPQTHLNSSQRQAKKQKAQSPMESSPRKDRPKGIAEYYQTLSSSIQRKAAEEPQIRLNDKKILPSSPSPPKVSTQQSLDGREKQLQANKASEQSPNTNINKKIVEQKAYNNPNQINKNKKENNNNDKKSQSLPKALQQKPQHQYSKIDTEIKDNKKIQPQKIKGKNNSEQIKQQTQKSPKDKSLSNRKENQTQEINQSKREVDKPQSSAKIQEKTQKKEIKMKISKYTIDSLKEYLQSYQFHPEYSQHYDLKQILRETQMQQTYIFQFTVNSHPGAIVLASVTQNNNFVIRLWALSRNCQPAFAAPLFKKYVDYLEKQVSNQDFYYRGAPFNQIAQAGFTPFKRTIFLKKRTVPHKAAERQFKRFISVECSQVSFDQTQKGDLLYSAEIDKFTKNNSKGHESILFAMKSQNIPAPLSQNVKVMTSVPNLSVANKVLSKSGLDTYEADSQVSLQGLSLSMLQYCSPFKCLFVAYEGVFKFYGSVVVQRGPKLICSIRLSNNNGRLCFAKGYQTIEELEKDLKEDSSNKAQFLVPMFNKRLYGRFDRSEEGTKAVYGNWDISLFWDDEMQGAIHRTFSGLSFGQGLFYVCVELQDQPLLYFSVSNNDLIY